MRKADFLELRRQRDQIGDDAKCCTAAIAGLYACDSDKEPADQYQSVLVGCAKHLSLMPGQRYYEKILVERNCANEAEAVRDGCRKSKG